MDFSGLNAIGSILLVVIPALVWTLLVFRRPARHRERALRLRATLGVWLATGAVIAFLSALPAQVAMLAWVTLVIGLAGSYRWLGHRQSELRYRVGAGSYLFSRKAPSSW